MLRCNTNSQDNTGDQPRLPRSGAPLSCDLRDPATPQRLLSPSVDCAAVTLQSPPGKEMGTFPFSFAQMRRSFA
jgi:hypothetical protein